jgi:hypothetical protein
MKEIMGKFRIGTVWVAAVAVICMGMLSAGSASASLLFYDGFNGADGTAITTYNSGYGYTGFGDPSVRKAEIDAPGLTVPGKYSVGNSLYLSTNGNNGLNRYDHGFTNTVVNTNTIYASALFKADTLQGNPGTIYVDVPVTGNSPFQAQFGIETLSGTTSLFGNVSGQGGEKKSLGQYQAGETIQLVWKYVYNTATEDVDIYGAVNPSVLSEPVWTSFGNAYSGVLHPNWTVNGVRVATDTNNLNASGWIDEIRIGTTYGDAVSNVPIPGALWLFAPAMAGLAWLRRRFTK